MIQSFLTLSYYLNDIANIHWIQDKAHILNEFVIKSAEERQLIQQK